jgi:hypothetical protein
LFTSYHERGEKSIENLEKPKRKTVTSWQVKAKYNAKAYRSFSSQIKPELFDRLDRYIKREGLSKSEFLQRAIEALEE